MKLWSITHPDRPTFFLDENVQGIVNAGHAKTVALSVMGFGEDERWRTGASLLDLSMPAMRVYPLAETGAFDVVRRGACDGPTCSSNCAMPVEGF